MTASRNKLTAADDAQRMLLWCILHDALESQFAAEAACLDCQAGSVACLRHWDAHEVSASSYHELQMQLEHYTGRPYGFPLTAQVQRLISAAIDAAIAFRSAGQTMEDLALTTAYRMLRRDLTPAASRGAAMGMTA